MKKTLFLTHILAAVIACSGISHAQDETRLVEMKGDQTIELDEIEVFVLSVTGKNNWIQTVGTTLGPLRLGFENPSKIVNGELSLENVKLVAQLGVEKFEMGANSRLSLGGTDVALVWFNITGPSVVFDNGVINLWENQKYTLGGNMSGTANVILKDRSQVDLGGKTLTNPVTIESSATFGNGTYNGALAVKDGKTLTLSGDLGGTGTITMGNNTTLNLGGGKITKDFVWSGDFSIGNGTADKALEVKEGKTLTLCGDLGGEKSVILREGGKLNLNGKTISKPIEWAQESSIVGAGAITGDLILANNGSYTWSNENVQLTGCNVVLGWESEIDLSNKTIGTATLNADNSSIFNGSIADNLILGNGVSRAYTWSDDELRLDGGVILRANAKFDLNNRTIKTVTLDGTGAVISNGAISENLTLTGGASYTWGSNYIRITGTVTLEDQATLNLDSIPISHHIIVAGNAIVKGTGTLNANVEVKGGTGRLALQGVTLGDNAAFSMGDEAQLDLGMAETELDRLHFTGQSAVVDNGTLTVAADETLMLGGNLSGTGTVAPGDKATLNLNGKILSTSLVLSGDACVGNGVHDGTLAVIDGKTLTLSDNLSGTGEVTLGTGAALNLNGKILGKAVTLDGSATISGGTHNGDMKVGAGKTLILGGNLAGSGRIILANTAVLDLGNATLEKDVTLNASATIGGGTLNRALSVATGWTLTLGGNLSGSGGVTLEDNAKLNLGNAVLEKDVTLKGSATIGGGTLNGAITMESCVTIDLSADLDGKGSLSMDYGSTLDLSSKTLSKAVVLEGDATIGGGTHNGSLTVKDGKRLTLSADLGGEGSITLGYESTLDLHRKTLSKNVVVDGDATLSFGTRDGMLNGTISISAGKTLTMSGHSALKGSDGIILGDQATLNLNSYDLYKAVTLEGRSATIGRGTLYSNVSVGEGKRLSLNGNMICEEGKIVLDENATLDLASNTLENGLVLKGSATIGNGTFRGALSVGAGKTLTLGGNLNGEGGVTLGNGATLNLGNATLDKAVTLEGSATIGGGTLNGSLSVGGAGKTLALGGNLQGSADITIDGGALELGNNTWSKSGTSQGGTKVLYTVQGKGESSGIGGHAKADATGLAGASETSRAQVQGVRLTTQANFTISDTDICDSLIDIGKGTTMTLKNVNIRAGSRFTDDTAFMEMENTRAELKKGANTLATSVEMMYKATELRLSGNNAQTVTMTAGNWGVNLSCSMFDSVTLDGGDLWLDMTDIAGSGTLEGWNFFTLTFVNMELANEVKKALVNVKNMSVSVTLDGSSYATKAYFNPTELQGDYAPRLYFLLEGGPEPSPVPEPTTGALSLLGLGLLASRRKRH